MDSLKSRKYNLMVAGSSPAENISDKFVLYKIFENSIKFLKNYMKKYMKRTSSRIIKRITFYPDISG